MPRTKILPLLLAAILLFAVFSLCASAEEPVGTCIICGETCGYEAEYIHSIVFEYIHYVKHWCDNCGFDQINGIGKEQHTYEQTSDGRYRCIYCGHTARQITRCPHTNVVNVYQPYNSVYHKVVPCCEVCGERRGLIYFEQHYDNNGDGKCDACGYSSETVLITVTWDAATNGGTVNGDGYMTGTFAFGAYPESPGDAYKESYNFDGWFTEPDGDIRCDENPVTKDTTFYAGFSLSRVFSATVPASLALTVSGQGEVYAAVGAYITNNSTAEIKVSAVHYAALNGWSFAPFGYNMAAEKVDAKRIGFTLNGFSTSGSGGDESLAVSWLIPQNGSLPLIYDANISATSVPITGEEVMTVVFVLEWAE